MISRRLQNRLRSLTDALILEESVEAAFLASVLLAAQDAVQSESLPAFAMRVWRANNAQDERKDQATSKRARTKTSPSPAQAAPKRPSRGRKAG